MNGFSNFAALKEACLSRTFTIIFSNELSLPIKVLGYYGKLVKTHELDFEKSQCLSQQLRIYLGHH